jgi:hypothetical protein
MQMANAYEFAAKMVASQRRVASGLERAIYK